MSKDNKPTVNHNGSDSLEVKSVQTIPNWEQFSVDCIELLCTIWLSWLTSVVPQSKSLSRNRLKLEQGLIAKWRVNGGLVKISYFTIQWCHTTVWHYPLYLLMIDQIFGNKWEGFPCDLGFAYNLMFLPSWLSCSLRWSDLCQNIFFSKSFTFFIARR